MYFLWRSISLVSAAPYHFFNLQNLTNVLFTVNCFMGKCDKCFLTLVTTYEDLQVCMVCGNLWWTKPRPQLHCQFNNRLLTQRRHSTPQQTMVHYTSGATKSRLHNSALQFHRGYESPTYQQPFNNSSPYGRDLAAQTTFYWEKIKVPADTWLLQTRCSNQGPQQRRGWIEYQMSAIVNLEGCLREKEMWARSWATDM